MFQSPGDTLFTFHAGAFNFSLHYYGVFFVFAVIVGILTVRYVTKKYYPKIPLEVFYSAAPLILLVSIIGARLYYVCLDWRHFQRFPVEIFAVWNGGLSWHGGLFAGFLCTYFICKKNNIGFLKAADIASFGLLLAQAVGRWGNFFNSEAFGKPCDLSFKLFIPVEDRPFQYLNNEFFHPAFLYEFFWNIAVFILLFFFLRKRLENIPGAIFASYLILYSFGRILIESVRVDTVAFVAGIPVPTLMSVGIILFSSVFLAFQVRKVKN